MDRSRDGEHGTVHRVCPSCGAQRAAAHGSFDDDGDRAECGDDPVSVEKSVSGDTCAWRILGDNSARGRHAAQGVFVGRGVELVDSASEYGGGDAVGGKRSQVRGDIDSEGTSGDDGDVLAGAGLG